MKTKVALIISLILSTCCILQAQIQTFRDVGEFGQALLDNNLAIAYTNDFSTLPPNSELASFSAAIDSDNSFELEASGTLYTPNYGSETWLSTYNINDPVNITIEGDEVYAFYGYIFTESATLGELANHSIWVEINGQTVSDPVFLTSTDMSENFFAFVSSVPITSIEISRGIGNDVYVGFDEIGFATAIPEPGQLAMGIVALALALGLRARRKK